MELALITMKKIIEMFIILLIGVVSYKADVIDGAFNKRLSSFLLKVITPCMILNSYQIEFRQDRLRGLIIMLLLALISYSWTIASVYLMIPKNSSKDVEIERFASIYSNCGFMGIPLISALYGAEGVFYISTFITSYNIMIWSHGVALMCGAVDLKKAAKNFIQPSTIAIAVGLAMYVSPLRLPSMIANPVATVGGMNTPVAMLVAGCNLAAGNFLGTLKRPRSYYISFIKLIAVPVLSIVIMKFIPLDPIIIMTALIAIACPSGAMGTMLAMEYNKNATYASELFAMTTVLSAVTIPLNVLIMGLLIG